jgi:hypothetical protein
MPSLLYIPLAILAYIGPPNPSTASSYTHSLPSQAPNSTSLYAAYFDVLGTGLIKRLPGLHARYGSVVRIQPEEVHIGTVGGYVQYVETLPPSPAWEKG